MNPDDHEQRRPKHKITEKHEDTQHPLLFRRPSTHQDAGSWETETRTTYTCDLNSSPIIRAKNQYRCGYSWHRMIWARSRALPTGSPQKEPRTQPHRPPAAEHETARLSHFKLIDTVSIQLLQNCILVRAGCFNGCTWIAILKCTIRPERRGGTLTSLNQTVMEFYGTLDISIGM